MKRRNFFTTLTAAVVGFALELEAKPIPKQLSKVIVGVDPGFGNDQTVITYCFKEFHGDWRFIPMRVPVGEMQVNHEYYKIP